MQRIKSSIEYLFNKHCSHLITSARHEGVLIRYLATGPKSCLALPRPNTNLMSLRISQVYYRHSSHYYVLPTQVTKLRKAV